MLNDLHCMRKYSQFKQAIFANSYTNFDSVIISRKNPGMICVKYFYVPRSFRLSISKLKKTSYFYQLSWNTVSDEYMILFDNQYFDKNNLQLIYYILACLYHKIGKFSDLADIRPNNSNVFRKNRSRIFSRNYIIFKICV